MAKTISCLEAHFGIHVGYYPPQDFTVFVRLERTKNKKICNGDINKLNSYG